MPENNHLAFLAQKHETMFRALDLLNKGSSPLHALAQNYTLRAVPVLATSLCNFFQPSHQTAELGLARVESGGTGELRLQLFSRQGCAGGRFGDESRA